jgi:23S rRNA U2552 (ribose-2'-O)-methylase RlmE/FtsJ
VFKLEEVDQREKLLEPGSICLDLRAATGAMYLAELALDMAAKVLKGGGAALIKVFQGTGFQELVRAARGRFAKVKLVKPTAS